MIPTALFHWAPTERRPSIRVHGLVPYQRPTVCSGEQVAPYVCLSPTPSIGWALSGAILDWHETEEWDLWQVQVPETAEVHVRPSFGPKLEEIKVYTAIAASYLWFVGHRGIPTFEAK